MKPPVEARTIFNYMCGLWQFTREVRSSPERRIMALVVDGKASFLPHRKCHSHDTAENDRVLPHDNFRNHPSGTEETSDSQVPDALLYREYGILTNLDHPSAKGPVTRQFLYESSGSDIIEAFNSSMRVKSKHQQDPWNTEFSEEEVEKLDYFHQLRFEPQEMDKGVSEDGKNSVYDLNGCVAKSTYSCEPDMYEAEFFIVDDNNLRVKWAVEGPQKSYTIESAYKRKAEC